MCDECGYCERHCECGEDEHKRQRQALPDGLDEKILPARASADASAAASAELLSPVAEQQFHGELSYTDSDIPLNPWHQSGRAAP